MDDLIWNDPCTFWRWKNSVAFLYSLHRTIHQYAIILEIQAKMKKKLIFVTYYNHENWKKGSIRVKSRDPQKERLGPLPNVHTKFQLTNCNLEVSYARNKLKKWKNSTKKPLLRGCSVAHPREGLRRLIAPPLEGGKLKVLLHLHRIQYPNHWNTPLSRWNLKIWNSTSKKCIF